VTCYIHARLTVSSGRNLFAMEWWDKEILEHPELVSNLVEHPVPLKGITARAPRDPKPIEAMLTPAERKRLQKLKRQEKVKEMQDKVRMGLIAPPQPKVKIKNMMLVLGKEAVAGPSAIESAVRSQVDQRLKEHEERNEARRLDPETRRQKNIAKWTKPAETCQKLAVSIFLVFQRIHNKHKFKICKNAEQLHLGGVFIHSFIRDSDNNTFLPSLIVVEGSSKAVKRFDRLMLRRIKWNEKLEDLDKKEVEEDVKMEAPTEGDLDGDEDEDDDGSELEAGGGICKRVYHGMDTARRFTRWGYESVRDVEAATKFLTQRDCLQYWSILERYRDVKLDV
jgi:U4/U6 small nuclear ribonucleoprotein PRP3